MKPWDARIAHFLVRPLRDTWVHPNHLTTLRLATGLASAGCFAIGRHGWGGVLFVISGVLDHSDGELARLAGKSSPFGRTYDLIADAIVTTLVFVGIGFGLQDTDLGSWAPWLGVLSGVCAAPIFYEMAQLENRVGKDDAAIRSFAGFEVEDITYAIGPIAWFGGLVPFLVAASIGTPVFMIWFLRRSRFICSATAAGEG